MRRQAYSCAECGYESTGWLGRCPSCYEFNTFTLMLPQEKETHARSEARVIPITEIKEQDYELTRLPFPEIERVLGGGIAQGQVILFGGEPGIGKSTLLLQLSQAFTKAGKKVLYFSGEESPSQIQQRAKRLGALSQNLHIISSRFLENILDLSLNQYALILLDSLQTLVHSAIPQPAGSIAQVRNGAEVLQEKAKETGIPVLLVSHVTKEGGLAGPKLVEHIVDTVLYLEGDRTKEYRILRGIKNRFGATQEMAILEMTPQGLVEVTNASSYFLSEKRPEIGTTIVAIQEGQNTFFLEIQALVTPSPFQIPKRNTQGIQERRVSQIIAVLEKKAKIKLYDRDIFINCVGGIKVSDPAADFGVALAVASSALDAPLPDSLVVIGEIGLGGEIRKVPHIEKRIKEAERLGFQKIFVPAEVNYRGKIKIINYPYLKEAVRTLKEKENGKEK